MSQLASECGGPNRGVHEFVPHCTLLYNVDLRRTSSSLQCRAATDNGNRRRSDERDGENRERTSADAEEEEAEIGRNLLDRCMAEYNRMVLMSGGTSSKGRKVDSQKHQSSTTTPQDGHAIKSTRPIQMDATSYYYFPYPKAADDGRGFGCVISMLLVDTSPRLQSLHDAACAVFPPDERHAEAGGTFAPHLALVYAPECCGDWLQKWTDDANAAASASTAAAEDGGGSSNGRIADDLRASLIGKMRAGCISLWRTEGSIDQWYRVASLELPKQSQKVDEEYRFQILQPSSDAIGICQSIRDRVFIKEQSIPVHVERDGCDDIATHVLCWSREEHGMDDVPIATGRIIVEGAEAKLGRIAVLPQYRKIGLGSRIVRELEGIAASAGATRMSLTPHHYLEGFYKRLGFARVEGDSIAIVNDGCHLIKMEKAVHVVAMTVLAGAKDNCEENK